MKDVSVFLRRFLLLVFYANISTTSPFHLEGVKEPKTMSPVAKERWSGPSRTHQLLADPISERKHSVLSQDGDLLAMTSSSSRLTSRRLVAREDEDYQRDQGKEDGEEEDEKEDEERHTQTDRRNQHLSTDCRKRLDVDIESCLDGYERMLRNINPKEQLNDSFKLELCHEYEKTMQCLHLSFALCRPGHLHLQLIAYRLGYLRTFMEQTCDQVDNEDDASEQEEEEEGKEAAEDDDNGEGHTSRPPPPTTTTTMADLSSRVTADRPQMERQGIDGATTPVISTVNTTSRSAFTTSIVVSSDFSKSRTVVGPISSNSVSSASNIFSSSSTTTSRATSSSATRSAALGATSSDHVTTSGAGAECGDALGCGGRESEVDRQQRTSLRPMRTSQHPTTAAASTTILAAIFPVLNSTMSRGFNGGLKVDPSAATVAIQWPFFPSGSSTGEKTQTGALVTTASSSVGGTKAVQCQPGVTCSRTNSAGKGNRRSHSLDYCLALSAILLLVRRVNICLYD